MTAPVPQSTFRLTRFVAVQVRAWDEAIAFYRDVLGLRLAAGHKNEVRFEGDAITLFVERVSAEDAPPALAAQFPGKTFFEFEVSDFAAASAMLTAAGCRISSSGAGALSAMFTDPFGLSFHVYARGAALPEIDVIRLACTFFGTVQGVGFRQTNAKIAQSFPAVTGWIRNESDGSVALTAEGDVAQVEAFLARLQERWTTHITSAQIVRTPSRAEFRDFSIR